MITRLLTLALAATGLSVGGFQLGARQSAQIPTSEVAVPADLPPDHALTVALQEPTAEVSKTIKVRLQLLAQQMEKAKKTEEETRVRALRREITELEGQIQRMRLQKYIAREVRLKASQAPSKKTAKAKLPANQFAVRYVALADGKVRNRLEILERQRARRTVERRYEALAIKTLPENVRNRVLAETRGLRAEDGERGFALLIALRERAALNLTPQQVTKLQLLQADFLRRFAPLREESETGIRWRFEGKSQGSGEVDVVLDEKNEVIYEVKADRFTVSRTAPAKWTFQAAPGEKPPAIKTAEGSEYVLKFEAVKDAQGKKTAGKPNEKETQVYHVFLAEANDVEGRIQKLKDEIDDKVYEILNDDQGKRLRRLVAISLSPQP